MLLGEGRRVEFAEGIRRQPEESADHYTLRLTELFSTTSAKIAWLCVPPGGHVAPLCTAALTAGLHLIVEKPWLCSPEETAELADLAQSKNLVTGVHFEYCMLSEVERWRREYQQSDVMEFSGIFTLHRGDHLGLPPMQNLGSHLLSIRKYAAPNAKVAAIQCDYQSADARSVWLDAPGRRVATINFLGSKEPIVQRYVHQFEACLNGSPFPFDFRFARCVSDEIAALNDVAANMAATPPNKSD